MRFLPAEDIPDIDPYGCSVMGAQECMETKRADPCDTDALTNNPIHYIAKGVTKFASNMLSDSMTWWVETPTQNPDSDVVRLAQSYTWPLVALILVGSILVQAIRVALSRKPQPLVDIITGMIRYTLAVMLGTSVLGAAVVFIDGLSQWILESAKVPFEQTMTEILLFAPGLGAVGAIIVSVIVAILAIIQWILAFVRQAGLIILAALIPLAAAGSLTPETRPWLSKILSWCAALTSYKLVAALIFAIGFSLMSTPPPNLGDDIPAYCRDI